jgi:hypothetical protein
MDRPPGRPTAAGVIAGACLALAACSAQTDPAVVSGPTTARLAAHGRTDDSPGHFSFQYAPSAALLGTADGFVTPTRGPFPAHTPASGDVAFSEGVTALRPSTTYAFRVCGGDARFTTDVCGATRTFTTPAGKPAVNFATSTALRDGNAQIGQLTVADVDRDGNLDLAALGASAVGPALAGPVLLFRGNGQGGFAAPSSVGSRADGVTPAAITSGDFDNDGKSDLALGGSTAAGWALLLLRGDGRGGFTAGAPVAVDGAVKQLVPADVDRDGKLDLVVVAGGHVVVARGTGTGGFAASGAIDAAEGPARAAVRDMDHDGIADLVLATSSPAGVSILRGDGRGAFLAPHHASTPGGAPVDVVVADFDRDGNRDVAVPGAILRGDGAGSLRAAVAISGSPREALVVADFDGDGRSDLAGGTTTPTPSGRGSRMRVLLGNGDGTFQTPNDFDCVPQSPCSGPFGARYVTSAAADFFHDGRPSLVGALAVEGGTGLPLAIITVERNTTGAAAP